jgi:hypothetical protein
VGLGSLFLGSTGNSPLRAQLSILIGSAITAFFYAVLAAAGQVRPSIWILLCLNVLFILWRRRHILNTIRLTLTFYQDLVGRRLSTLFLILLTLLIFWAITIAPPRDADVMRYHLAHIRQILADGVWSSIPDYHYALPFGWSLNYLPFEYFHIPSGAHCLNLLLLLFTLPPLFRFLAAQSDRGVAGLVCALLVYQPSVLKAATTAHADMYVLSVATALTILMLKLPDLSRLEIGLLGFVG